MSHLRSLDLGGNDIKAEGITALMKAIEGHKQLRQLELGYNVVGAEGAQAVADALKYNTTVRFCLSCNDIGESEGMPIESLSAFLPLLSLTSEPESLSHCPTQDVPSQLQSLPSGK